MIAQSVEQRIENPCVPSSILGPATINLKFQSLIPSGIFFAWGFCVKNRHLKQKLRIVIDYLPDMRLNTRHWRDSSVGRATD